LPATTAAGGRGFNRQPSGTVTRKGLRQPALSGMSSSTRVRNTYSTAARVMDKGALKLLSSRCALVPVKSMCASRALRSTVTLTWMTAPLSRVSACWPSCSEVMARRTDASALSCTWRM